MDNIQDFITNSNERTLYDYKDQLINSVQGNNRCQHSGSHETRKYEASKKSRNPHENIY
jgi:hypothetical protein